MHEKLEILKHDLYVGEQKLRAAEREDTRKISLERRTAR